MTNSRSGVHEAQTSPAFSERTSADVRVKNQPLELVQASLGSDWQRRHVENGTSDGVFRVVVHVSRDASLGGEGVLAVLNVVVSQLGRESVGDQRDLASAHRVGTATLLTHRVSSTSAIEYAVWAGQSREAKPTRVFSLLS